MDIFCIGEMVIDFTPGKEPGSYIRNPGGAPANVAIAASRLGCKAGFCGMLGDDDFGRFLLATLSENRVEFTGPPLTSKATTTMAFVTLQKNGERTFTFARKPGADMLLSREDVVDEDIARSVIVHAGSCSLSAGDARAATHLALSKARKLGKLVSFDVNYRDLLWVCDEVSATREIMAALPNVDLLKVSDEEIYLLGGEEALPALMERYSIHAVVLTGGPGVTKLFCDGETLIRSAYTVTSIDTNGAGDAFWGAFLAEIIQSGATSIEAFQSGLLERAIDVGMLAGSLAVQRYGAIPSLPTREELDRAQRR